MTTIKLTEPITRGTRVRFLQVRLTALGFPCGDIDSAFGGLTDRAVRAFQSARGLKVDGEVGAKTWAAIMPTITEPSAAALGLKTHVLAHMGDLYTWGACGQLIRDGRVNGQAVESVIKRMDMTTTKAERSIATYQKKIFAGQTDIFMYDCSGLIAEYLIALEIIEKKANCNRLWIMSYEIERKELLPGDLLFRRRTDGDCYHVGVHIGRGRVVEAMGRDVGVVCRGIDQSGKKYWTDAARLIDFYLMEE